MDKLKALNKCMQICSRKEYCISEIHQKLKNWEVQYIHFNEIIDRLIADKFIDEERYANAFVNDKFKFNKWGKKKIAYALSQKGLSGYFIKQSINSINDDDYMAIINQLIQDKLPKVKANSEFERNNKVANYMASKGFEPDLVFQHLKSIEY